MMRCPRFEYRAPRSIREVSTILENSGPRAMLLAGGTDLVPKMKRRQQTPEVVVSLRRVRRLRERSRDGNTLRLGAMVTLAELAANSEIRLRHGALYKAAAQVATPHLRARATLGGNLCLDTRCNYYDQNHEWRAAINFCMKKDGQVCWVAPGSPRCWAVSSTDTAPAFMAMGAEVVLTSSKGDRRIPLADLYRNDGILYLNRKPHEILTDVLIPVPVADCRSTYWKLRRRGAFDFPVLSVAAWVRRGSHGIVEDARLVLGSVASHPIPVEAATRLVGRDLDDEIIDIVAKEGSALAKPLDNTDFALGWRKRVARHFIAGALKELRGDDPRTLDPTGRQMAEMIPVA